MVKGIRRWLGNTRNEEINCTAPLPQRVLSIYKIYGIHRRSYTYWNTKSPDGSEESHHYRNNGTIIGLLISKREVTCLLSGPRFDEGGGNFSSGNGSCILNGKSGRTMGKSTKIG